MKNKFLLEKILEGKAKSADMMMLNGLSVLVTQSLVDIDGLRIGVPDFLHGNPFVDYMKEDESARAFVRGIHYWNQEKNYIALTKDMSIALMNTKLTEVESRYLPDQFSAYIEYPEKTVFDNDGDVVVGSMVHFERLDSTYMMAISNLMRKPDNNSLMLGYVTLDPQEDSEGKFDIKTLVESYSHKVTYVENGEIKKRSEKAQYPEYLTLIINTVIYLTYESVPFKNNNFVGSKKAIETQKKIYCNVPYRLVGDGFSLPKTFSIDSTEVRGHFRWQRHGEGWTLLKYIFIEPHVRHYNKEQK